MAGTSFSLTLPTRPMPPRITAPVHRATTTPTASRSQPRAAWRAAEMELDWTIAPPVREAATHHRENHPAAPLHPSRRERYSIGPPSQPLEVRRRYFTAKVFSTKLVISPTKAEIHIQNTAPGPPKKMAVATPAMEPVPMVEARAVARAWIWVREPLAAFFFCPNRLPTEPLIQVPNPKS